MGFMYDQRFPNLRSLEECVDRRILKAVRAVCGRTGLSAAFCRDTRCVFFHLPHDATIGVWRETVDGTWDQSRVDRLCRVTNSRKMSEKAKLAEIERAKAEQEYEATVEREKADEDFERVSIDRLKFRHERRGMHNGYRPTVVKEW